MIEGHRHLLNNFPKWHQSIAALMELPEDPDFDLEGKTQFPHLITKTITINS